MHDVAASKDLMHRAPKVSEVFSQFMANLFVMGFTHYCSLYTRC